LFQVDISVIIRSEKNIMSFIREFLGKVGVSIQYFLLKRRFRNIIYFSDTDIYRYGFYLPYDLLQDIEKNVDLVIIYPEFSPLNIKASFKKLGNNLSKENKVLVREMIVKAGGGGDDTENIINTVKFVYESFQPFINIARDILITLVIEKIYKAKNNPITKSQFTIRRINNGTRYNYIFDKLNANDAIKASKLIPSIKIQKNLSDNNIEYFQDVYLRFESKKKVWIVF